MLNFLVILFAISSIYLSIAERFRTYSRLIAIQGLLLFGIAFLELKEVSTANLIFVVTETLIFKAIVVPAILYRIINRIKVYKVHSKALPGFYSLIFAIFGLFLSILVANSLKNLNIDTVYMTIALFTLFVGVLLIVTHKLIFSHMIGFLIIENSVFMFSLAVGTDMPMLINIGILLDIFVSVMIISVLLNKIGSKFSDLESESLTTLKD
jgi:hydrogenase-4 component E